MNKDLEIATRLGRELHLPMFVGELVQQLYNYMASHGGEDECHTAIIKFIEGWRVVKMVNKEGG